ncbi:uncharacterized protein LOC143297154 [Babylonia areolata]|uniref:uncharacterized protein LOC143297154 n=1 Tax=Babylonia areolata TaxID=304850 RepID=UPI003FD17F63
MAAQWTTVSIAAQPMESPDPSMCLQTPVTAVGRLVNRTSHMLDRTPSAYIFMFPSFPDRKWTTDWSRPAVPSEGSTRGCGTTTTLKQRPGPASTQSWCSPPSITAQSLGSPTTVTPTSRRDSTRAASTPS